MLKGRLGLFLILTLIMVPYSFALTYRYFDAQLGDLVNFSTEQYDTLNVSRICLYNVTPNTSNLNVLDPLEVHSLDYYEFLPFGCDPLIDDGSCSPPPGPGVGCVNGNYIFLMTPIHDNIPLCQNLDETYCHWNVRHNCTAPVCDPDKTFADCSYFNSTLNRIVPCACPLNCETDGQPTCDCSDYSILTSKNEFGESFPGLFRQYYYCGEAIHGPSTDWNWTGDDITLGCFVINVTKPKCPNEAIPVDGDVCYKPDYYNWGACNNSFSLEGTNECRGTPGDAFCEYAVGPGSQCYCLPLINLTLDIGRVELPREWENSSYYFEREKVWNPPKDQEVLDRINNILKSNCGGSICPGCSVNSQNCSIPFHFITHYYNETFIPANDIIKGNLTVDDILFRYHQYGKIDSVPYDETFSYAEGANWTFDYLASIVVSSPITPVPDDCGVECEGQSYQTPTPCDAPSPADDATDDAMYRLLVRLDNYSDGIIHCYIDWVDTDGDGSPDVQFDPQSIFFDVEKRLKTPMYWGPVSVKLVVWA